MLLSMPGQKVRCISCGNRFEPGAPAAPPPVERLPPLDALPADESEPRRPEPAPRGRASDPPPWPDADRYPPRRLDVPLVLRPLLDEDVDGLPFCPGCGRRVRWEVLLCPHCDEEFEDDRDLRRQSRRASGPARREKAPHRGPLLANLGNICITLGILSLCGGVTALIGLPIGVVGLVLANGDLDAMQNGVMDARGRKQTESGRGNAIAGLAFCGVFAAGWLVLWFCLH